MATELFEVEVVISSRDEAVVTDIESALASVQPTRWRDARIVDPVTILAVAAGLVELVDHLIALKKRLAVQETVPRVEIKTADGASVALSDATPEMLTEILRKVHEP